MKWHSFFSVISWNLGRICKVGSVRFWEIRLLNFIIIYRINKPYKVVENATYNFLHRFIFRINSLRVLFNDCLNALLKILLLFLESNWRPKEHPLETDMPDWRLTCLSQTDKPDQRPIEQWHACAARTSMLSTCWVKNLVMLQVVQCTIYADLSEPIRI